MKFFLLSNIWINPGFNCWPKDTSVLACDPKFVIFPPSRFGAEEGVCDNLGIIMK